MNKMPAHPAQFLSEISWRHPRFKFHDKLAHAKNALSLKGYGTIYQWNFETSSWDVIYDVPLAERRYGSREKMPWAVDSEDAPPLPGL
jgi:hypothetical protein